jgi:hypothetical protein
MSRATKSSPEHVTDCLRSIAKVIRPKWKREEVEDGVRAYVEILVAYEPQAIRFACERWVQTRKVWPAVSDLVSLIQASSRAPQADEDPRTTLGSEMRNEAIQLLGVWHFATKSRFADEASYRGYVAEAARLWGKVRPAGGLEEVTKMRARSAYGFALEAAMRHHLGDEPVHISYASQGMREVYQRMTDADLLTRGELTVPPLSQGTEP